MLTIKVENGSYLCLVILKYQELLTEGLFLSLTTLSCFLCFSLISWLLLTTFSPKEALKLSALSSKRPSFQKTVGTHSERLIWILITRNRFDPSPPSLSDVNVVRGSLCHLIKNHLNLLSACQHTFPGIVEGEKTFRLFIATPPETGLTGICCFFTRISVEAPVTPENIHEVKLISMFCALIIFKF